MIITITTTIAISKKEVSIDNWSFTVSITMVEQEFQKKIQDFHYY